MGDYVDRAQFVADEYTRECVARQLAKSHPNLQARPDDGPRYCEGCGCVIPEARISAIPDAVLCVDCKQLEERRHA